MNPPSKLRIIKDSLGLMIDKCPTYIALYRTVTHQSLNEARTDLDSSLRACTLIFKYKDLVLPLFTYPDYNFLVFSKVACMYFG